MVINQFMDMIFALAQQRSKENICNFTKDFRKEKSLGQGLSGMLIYALHTSLNMQVKVINQQCSTKALHIVPINRFDKDV